MKHLWASLLAMVLLVACCLVLPMEADAATEGYYTYTVSGGTATITDCDTAISGDITIPATLGGYPVTAIGNSAFRDCISLTAATIPDSVTTIGKYAFSGCDSLTSVTIPDSVTTIGNYAFSGCDSLTSMTIGDSVTTIGTHAFLNCDSLTSVTIADSVTTIGDYAFQWCDSLTGIWVSENNPAYSSDASGVLFNKDKTVLIQAPGEITGRYSIPDSVTAIGMSAFSFCGSLTSVTIPDSVTTIDMSAFLYCASLTSVTIADSVTTIGRSAFASCDSLQNVYYAADSMKWNQISIGSNNEALTNATIHYSHVHDYTLLTVAATCEYNGNVEYRCVYGEVYWEWLPKLPHSYAEEEIVVASTCTEDGYIGYQCIQCGYVNKKETVLALGHNMVVLPVAAPTCTEPGLTAGSQCERCSMVGVAQTEVPPAGHSFADGVCTVCGAPDYTPGDLDGNETVDEEDAIYLLQHVLMPDLFPVTQSVDYDGNGCVDVDDAIYLLLHALLPEYFPL